MSTDLTTSARARFLRTSKSNQRERILHAYSSTKMQLRQQLLTEFESTKCPLQSPCLATTPTGCLDTDLQTSVVVTCDASRFKVYIKGKNAEKLKKQKKKQKKKKKKTQNKKQLNLSASLRCSSRVFNSV